MTKLLAEEKTQRGGRVSDTGRNGIRTGSPRKTRTEVEHTEEQDPGPPSECGPGTRCGPWRAFCRLRFILLVFLDIEFENKKIFKLHVPIIPKM